MLPERARYEGELVARLIALRAGRMIKMSKSDQG
jgi:hypothetical protein